MKLKNEPRQHVRVLWFHLPQGGVRMFVCSVGVMLRDPSLTLLSHLLIIGAACNRSDCTYVQTFKHEEKMISIA